MKHSPKKASNRGARHQLETLAQTLAPADWHARVERLYADLAALKHTTASAVGASALQAQTKPIQPAPPSPLPPSPQIIFPGNNNDKKRFQFLMTFHFRPPTPAFALATRGERSTENRLLLSEQLTLDKHPIHVQAWLDPNAKPDRANMRLNVVSAAPLAPQIHAILHWDENHYEKTFARGKTTFREIAVPSADSRVSLTLEFLVHERSRRHPKTRSTSGAAKRAPQGRAKKV